MSFPSNKSIDSSYRVSTLLISQASPQDTFTVILFTDSCRVTCLTCNMCQVKGDSDYTRHGVYCYYIGHRSWSGWFMEVKFPPNVCLTLCQRRRRWTNHKSTLSQCHSFCWLVYKHVPSGINVCVCGEPSGSGCGPLAK